MLEINVRPAGGGAMLHGLFGRSIARMLLFRGDRISAEETYRLGAVAALADPQQLLPEARKLVNKISSKTPIGVRYAKRSANLVALMSPRDGYRFEQGLARDLADTDDALEGRRAFLEHREPRFRGR